MKHVVGGLCVALVLTVGVSVAVAGGNKPGNSTNAAGKVCQKGKWEGLVTSAGVEFTSQDDCTAYVNTGGTVYTDAQADACLNDAYAMKATANGDPFVDAAACAAYIASNPGSIVSCTIIGTSGDDFLTPTAGADVLCGFGGNDMLGTAGTPPAPVRLDADDTFYGGAGDDRVGTATTTDDRGSVYGVFHGGDGNDTISHVLYGTFEGGEGNDAVLNTVDTSGTFNGGSGNDDGGSSVYGVFNGGPGNDSAYRSTSGGTFNGGDGDDSLAEVDFGGVFYGDGGNDRVSNIVDSGGVFYGGDGNDSVDELWGTFYGEAGDDTVTLIDGGTFDGGADTDTVTTCISGTIIAVEIGACPV